jgi:lipoyl-dependent peroxiredoxin
MKSRAPIRRSCLGRLTPPVSPCLSFVRLLGMADFVPERVDSKSEVVIDKDGDGFSITSVHLTVTAKIPGVDQNTFLSIAAKAKAGCPVSKLIKVEIGFEATLSP